MKGIKVLLGALAIMAITQSCSDDFGPSYDPNVQLPIDLATIDSYITTNNLTVQIHETDIRYIIHTEGNGKTVALGDVVSVNYELYLLDGTLVQTNVEQIAINNGFFNPNGATYEPYDFIAGQGSVILGFDISTQILTEGGSGTFFIPSVYAYQNTGTARIPANSNLKFKIELLEVKK
tara:strand:- start:748 stop:1281 length:534 start_codon:yes stop_codon:yes gene_type:complete